MVPISLLIIWYIFSLFVSVVNLPYVKPPNLEGIKVRLETQKKKKKKDIYEANSTNLFKKAHEIE